MTPDLILVPLLSLSCAIVMAMIWRDARRRSSHTTPAARLGLAMGVLGWGLGTAAGMAGALLGGLL